MRGEEEEVEEADWREECSWYMPPSTTSRKNFERKNKQKRRQRKLMIYLKGSIERLESEIVDGKLPSEVDEARAGARLTSRVGEVGEGGGGREEEEAEHGEEWW